jgi:hypothetical protein
MIGEAAVNCIVLDNGWSYTKAMDIALENMHIALYFTL